MSAWIPAIFTYLCRFTRKKDSNSERIVRILTESSETVADFGLIQAKYQ